MVSVLDIYITVADERLIHNLFFEILSPFFFPESVYCTYFDNHKDFLESSLRSIECIYFERKWMCLW